MAKLMVGIDLGGRTLTLSIPSDTVASETKVIARTDRGNTIQEFYQADTTTGRMVINGTPLVFYSKTGDNPPSVNLPSYHLTEEFGVITEVDETATLFPFITREANEKAYLMGEDKARVEGYSKAEVDERVGDKGTLLASGFTAQGAEKTFSVAGYNWLVVECLVSVNATYGMTAPPFVVPLNGFPNKTGSTGLVWTVLGRNNNYLNVSMYYNENAETIRTVLSKVENGGAATSIRIYGMR